MQRKSLRDHFHSVVRDWESVGVSGSQQRLSRRNSLVCANMDAKRKSHSDNSPTSTWIGFSPQTEYPIERAMEGRRVANGHSILTRGQRTYWVSHSNRDVA